jgi:polysaccharide pyruvyl transferase WcaK-like protein
MTGAKRRRRIALIGNFGSGNFGNDGSCEAVLGYLRQTHPEAAISIICNDPKGIAQRFQAPTAQLRFAPRGWLRLFNNLLLRGPSVALNLAYAFKTLVGLDLILFPGTGVFDDYRSGPMGAPAQLVRWCGVARLLGVKVACVSVGAGPIVHPLSKSLMRLAAKLANSRSYRDQESKDFMIQLGVDDADSAILPDVAFLLPTPPHEETPAGAPITVGVGVMAYHGWRSIEQGATIYADYLTKLARFMDWLAARGHRIRLIVGETSDWRAVRDVETRLAPETHAAIEPVADMGSLHDVMSELAHTDIVVGTRFHVVVCALKLGLPTISLSYGYKNDALLTAAGLDGFFQHADGIDFDKLIAHFTAMEADRLRYGAIVRERVATFGERLHAPGALAPEKLLR